ncbi:hypothetical protein AAKU52_001874 [Pedobacter sp. CG_S7]|uniref:hypothetical protein n=1 Tax=Pedobacter sp. CG_S7 TaxID=3143930 RepID=UPI003394DEBB
MKKIYNNIRNIVAVCVISTVVFSCSMVGLDLQENYDRVPHTLDPKIYKTTWQYLKDRSAGTTAEDKIFSSMMDAIQYAGIDSNEYKKPERTFILLHNLAATDLWKNIKVNNVVGTSFRSYPKEFVKNYLLYLILEGVHDHYTIPTLQTVNAHTLAPVGYFNSLPTGITMTNFIPGTNPESRMLIKVLNSSPSNTSDYPIQLNDLVNIRTSSLLATNGSIHVLGNYFSPVLPL